MGGGEWIGNVTAITDDRHIFSLQMLTVYSQYWGLRLMTKEDLNCYLSRSQRIYISVRRDSTPLRLPNIFPPTPCSVYTLKWTVYSNYLTVWQSRRSERLGGQMFGRRRGVLSLLSLIQYIFFGATSPVITEQLINYTVHCVHCVHCVWNIICYSKPYYKN